MSENAVPESDLMRLFQQQKACFHARMQASGWRERLKRLRALHAWVMQHQDALAAAVVADMKKSPLEAMHSDVYPVAKELRTAIKYLDLWMQPRRVSPGMTMLLTRSQVVPEPKGCSLILAPWNFPLMLAAGPLVSAVAAGNTVMLKPSEFAPHTGAIIRQMVEAVFPPEEVVVVEGDYRVAESLMRLPFDHVFFTGSPAVGKKVMHAAADQLMDVTLELGGKNTVIVDETADIRDTARKLIFGKRLNAGQSCLSPDWLLVHKAVRPALEKAMQEAVQQLFPGELRAHPDYARLIHARHWQRIQDWVTEAQTAGGTLVFGGKGDVNDLYFDLTLLRDVPAHCEIMQEEIFGPVMVMNEISSLEEAIRLIQGRPKPLAIYHFSTRRAYMQRVQRETSSGSLLQNETTIHFLHPNLPFGGMNMSGLGKSHGEYGFRAFTHYKSLMRQTRRVYMALLFYPPFNRMTRLVTRVLVRWL